MLVLYCTTSLYHIYLLSSGGELIHSSETWLFFAIVLVSPSRNEWPFLLALETRRKWCMLSFRCVRSFSRLYRSISAELRGSFFILLRKTNETLAVEYVLLFLQLLLLLLILLLLLFKRWQYFVVDVDVRIPNHHHRYCWFWFCQYLLVFVLVRKTNRMLAVEYVLLLCSCYYYFAVIIIIIIPEMW